MGLVLALLVIGALVWWLRDAKASLGRLSPRTRALRIGAIGSVAVGALFLLRPVFRGGMFIGAGLALAAVATIVGLLLVGRSLLRPPA